MDLKMKFQKILDKQKTEDKQKIMVLMNALKN